MRIMAISGDDKQVENVQYKALEKLTVLDESFCYKNFKLERY